MNKIRPEAWIHGTDWHLRGEVGGGDWKRLAKEHRCMYAELMDTDNNVVEGQGGGTW